MKYEVKEVCQFCYKISNHKSAPKCTPKSKANGVPLVCSECRQEWVSQLIARIDSGKVVSLRPRPPLPVLTNYDLCRHRDCPRGSTCTFAHSDVELHFWFRQRLTEEPRLSPNPKSKLPYEICHSILRADFCKYGVKCINPHSEAEVAAWRKTIPQKSPSRDSSNAGSPECRQLSERLGPASPQNVRPRPKRHKHALCRHVDARRPCPVGDECNFAHSLEELDSWRRQLMVERRTTNLHRRQSESMSSDGESLVYTSETDESDVLSGFTKDNCLEQYRKAVKENATVTMCIVKAMTIGPPRVGKTWLRSLLLGQAPPDVSLSTPVLKAAETVSMVSTEELAVKFEQKATVSSDTVLASPGHWSVIDTPNGIQSLLRYLAGTENGAKQVQQSMLMSSWNDAQPTPLMAVAETPLAPGPVNQLSKAECLPQDLAADQTFGKPIVDKLYESIRHGKFSDAKVNLFDAKLLQFLDSGGQLSYHDILPVFITTPALYLHVFNLNQRLEELPHDTIELESGKPLPSVQSPLSTIDMISRSLLTVHSIANRKMELPCLAEKRYSPETKMILVGTHLDELEKKLVDPTQIHEELQSVNKRLDKCISSHVKTSIIRNKVSDGGMVFFPVDNGMYAGTAQLDTDVNESIVRQLRMEMEKVAKEVKLVVPIRWYLHQLALTSQNHERPFWVYKDLLQSCLTNKVVKDPSEFHAMIHLFHVLGLVVHHDVGDQAVGVEGHGLKSQCLIFSNPSFLYQNISKLYIVQFDPVCDGAKSLLKRNGILTMGALRDLQLDEKLDYEWFFNLLLCLHIGEKVHNPDPLKGRALFIPSVLVSNDQNIPLPDEKEESHVFAVTFETHKSCYIPCGVFTTTIASLQSLDDWQIMTDNISRTTMTFAVGAADYIQLRDCIAYIRVRFTCSDEMCHEYRDQVLSALSDAYEYLFHKKSAERASLVLGLPCHLEKHDDQTHIAELRVTLNQKRLHVRCQRKLKAKEITKEKTAFIFLTLNHTAVSRFQHTPAISLEVKETKPFWSSEESALPSPPTPPAFDVHDLSPSEPQLRRYICGAIISNWKAVCTFLGVPHPKVVEVARNNPNDITEACFEAILYWRDGENEEYPPTWKVLFEALREANFSGLEKELKNKLEAGSLKK